MNQNNKIHLPGDHPWQNHIVLLESVDSTNTYAKILAEKGAPEGTCVIARQQTGGKGRMGRSFYSPAGHGMYLSVILRPECTPDKLMHLTCAVAVAVCNAIEKACGKRPQVKWINDLIFSRKKLGGILTELSIDPITGLVRYAIAGIGINCTHQKEDLPQQLQSFVTSLAMEGAQVSALELAEQTILALYEMNGQLLSNQKHLMDQYKKDCMTIGQQVVLRKAEELSYGTALDLDPNGGLIVQFQDGTVQTVSSGEISVRGMYGYV